jgi:hypothetical protein
MFIGQADHAPDITDKGVEFYLRTTDKLHKRNDEHIP